MTCPWCADRSQQTDMDHQQFLIGPINYFGYSGIDLAAVQAKMPLHTGDTLKLATFSEDPAKAAVAQVTGYPPTDIDVVCCDGQRRLLIFIGLGGTSSRAMSAVAMPNSADHLDPAALQLYEQEMTALQAAVTSGNAGEDDSQGYMLSNDPTLHKINLAMRDYAVHREAEFIRVLRNASDPKQRQVAATLLGYVPRSATQASALVQAVNDPDGEVRNNAIRTLEVLSARKNAAPLSIDARALISLVFSDKWSDRNKGSLLLFRITEGRDQFLLKTLRTQALQPLIEGASWASDPGHSTPFLTILGRIAGIPEEKLQKMIDNGDSAGIIDAAKRSLSPTNH